MPPSRRSAACHSPDTGMSASARRRPVGSERSSAASAPMSSTWRRRSPSGGAGCSPQNAAASGRSRPTRPMWPHTRRGIASPRRPAWPTPISHGSTGERPSRSRRPPNPRSSWVTSASTDSDPGGEGWTRSASTPPGAATRSERNGERRSSSATSDASPPRSRWRISPRCTASPAPVWSSSATGHGGTGCRNSFPTLCSSGGSTGMRSPPRWPPSTCSCIRERARRSARRCRRPTRAGCPWSPPVAEGRSIW